MDRDELIQLSVEGKIKYKKKFLKDADDETIEKISKEYVAKQLDATNEQVTEIIVEKFSDLMKQTEMVENDCDLKKKLSENKMFRNDLKSFVGSMTPYVPYIGLVSGLLTVAGYIAYKKLRSDENEDTPKEPEDAEPPKASEPPKAPKERKPRAPRKPRARESRRNLRKREAPQAPRRSEGKNFFTPKNKKVRIRHFSKLAESAEARSGGKPKKPKSGTQKQCPKFFRFLLATFFLEKKMHLETPFNEESAMRNQRRLFTFETETVGTT